MDRNQMPGTKPFRSSSAASVEADDVIIRTTMMMNMLTSTEHTQFLY